MSHWLEAVYKDDRDRLFRLAWLILRDAALAEDAIQAAFVQLARLAEPPECQSTYVFRCVRNAAIDERRRRGRRPTEPLVGNEPSTNNLSDECRLLLEEMLLSLGESQRDVVELRLRLGFTFAEIAELLGEPLSTVSSRYQRALSTLYVVVRRRTMNELERQISELPLPRPSGDLDARIRQVFDTPELNRNVRHVASNRTFPSSLWRSKVSYRLAFVLATVLLLAVMTTWPPGSSRVLAFGDVVESAKLVKTIQYVFKRVYFTELPAGGLPIQSLEDGKYNFRTDMREVAEQQARALEEQILTATTATERQELNLRIDLLRSHTQPEQPQLEHAVRVRAAIGGFERREPIFPPGGASISNAQTGKNVAFDNVRKKMLVIRQQIQDSLDGKPIPIDHIQTDVITQLISIPETDIERLRDKMLNGQLVSGFRRMSEMNGGTVQKDFWVDPASRLPIRIEKRFFEKGSSTPSIFSVYSDFVYDEALDDSFFSTEPPPGYEVDQATVTFHSEADDDDGNTTNNSIGAESQR